MYLVQCDYYQLLLYNSGIHNFHLLELLGLLSFHNTHHHLSAEQTPLAENFTARYKEPVWRDIQQRPIIDKEYLHWLLDSGSLTAKLIQKSGGKFRVSVLKQSICSIPLSERHILSIPNGQWAMVREVILYGNNTPWVYARTAVPLSTLQGPLRRLHYLGNKPLGEQLFTDPSMRRGSMQVAQFVPSQIPQHIYQEPLDNNKRASTWGRRSVFRLSSQPLLVSEVFLPALIYS
jgi:chorismate--pyruvate lyase